MESKQEINAQDATLIPLDELKIYYSPMPLTSYETTRFKISLEYNKLQTQWNHCDKVSDYLYLGRIIEDDFVIPAGVKLIVSVVTYGELNTIQFPYAKLAELGIKHIFLYMEDFDNDVSINGAINTLRNMWHCIQNEKNVYVHCKAGRARSGMLVACLLAHYKQLDLLEAITTIVEKRMQVDIGEAKRTTATTILHTLSKQSQKPKSPIFSTIDDYLASLQAKNTICQLPSFKVLANYLAGLRTTQNRAAYLSDFFLEIWDAQDASWYTNTSNETNRSRFINAKPYFFKEDDGALRKELLDHFLTDVKTLVLLNCQVVDAFEKSQDFTM